MSDTQPWLPSSPEWLEAIALHQQREFNQLLDELEHRAISRQFEVEKMGLPRTDYKTRQQISSLLAKRGKSLSSMLEKYNCLATAMNPPKPRLSWDDVISLEFLSDIVILQGRDDVHQKPWAKPLLCNATRAWYKLQQACEEIETVSLEARRVWAAMECEETHLRGAIENTPLTDPALAEYISITSRYHCNVNVHLHAKLTQLDKVAHFLTQREERPPASPAPMKLQAI
ncbi:uncharacterized protein EI90DRAFT_2901537 [Cantharellus anzutake]|uniref:uncharacterized protein n=1 Tax=Cantharellus anzutake TaxID=1750568 RepID=UPI001902C696|nr:uncharacterized protein EI90DRAFT_2901537 [Cantharellus anzutake]KAF8343852.1 hypothetical protein EI90DRAFT_2901537 [Cantharellus anzutake]